MIVSITNLSFAYPIDTNINYNLFDRSKSFMSIKNCYGDIKIKVTQEIKAPDYYIKDCDQFEDNKWKCSCNNKNALFMYTNKTSNTYTLRYSYEITPEEYSWSTITDQSKFSIANGGKPKTFQTEDIMPLIWFGGSLAIILFLITIFILIKTFKKGGDGFEELG